MLPSPRKARLHTLGYIVLCTLAFWLMHPGGVAAQTIEGAFTLPGEIDVHGKGWAQLGNTEEILQFVLGLIEAVALTAALAFHPKTNGQRRDLNDWAVPRAMFLFALIGLAVGFLVIHHGYLIGFVVFGVGSLFRFRMESVSLGDTALLILASLIGLAVGLDLPVMALAATAGTWAVVWIFGYRVHLVLEVKFKEKAELGAAIKNLERALEARGFHVANVSKSKSKPVAEFALTSTLKNARQELVHGMAETQASVQGISEWHV